MSQSPFQVYLVTHPQDSDDLKEMFDPCVEKTCNLIAGQIDQVRRAGSQVKVSHPIKHA